MMSAPVHLDAEARREDKKLYRLWKIWKTLKKLCYDRGFLVIQDELHMSLEDWKETIWKKETDMPSKHLLTFVVPHNDDPTDQMFVFFPDGEDVGLPLVKQYFDRMQQMEVLRAIIVVPTKITNLAKQGMTAMAPKYRMEQFLESELLVNITEHSLVPHHTVLTDAEIETLLKRYSIKKAQLPQMQVTDPISRYFGLQRGQVVKIIRRSETAGRYVTYRHVY